VIFSELSTKTGIIIRYSEGINEKNEIRTWFTHAIDFSTKVYEVAGLPEPKVLSRVQKIPIKGTEWRTHLTVRMLLNKLPFSIFSYLVIVLYTAMVGMYKPFIELHGKTLI
jgi:arylsulfatase A-like enzyme